MTLDAAKRKALAGWLAAVAGLLGLLAFLLAPERLGGILRDLRKGPPS